MSRQRIELFTAYAVGLAIPSENIQEVTLRGIRSGEGIELQVSIGYQGDSAPAWIEGVTLLGGFLGSGAANNGDYQQDSPYPEFRFSYQPPYDTVRGTLGKQKTFPIEQIVRDLFETTVARAFGETQKKLPYENPLSGGLVI